MFAMYLTNVVVNGYIGSTYLAGINILSGGAMGNKVGRNDPCPCGSGKKYKKCCLEKGENVIVFPVPDERSLDDALRRYQNFVEKWDSSRGPSPTFNEFMGRPNMATEEIRNIQEAFQGREFHSKEEMNAFLQEFTEAQNKEPREEFLGLSSAQVHQMMYRRISESGEIMIVERNISLISWLMFPH